MIYLIYFFVIFIFANAVGVFLFASQSDHDNAVDALDKKLNEVETGLSDAEHKKTTYDENDSVDLEAVMAQIEKQKVILVVVRLLS